MNDLHYKQLPWYVHKECAYHASAKAGSQSLLVHLLDASGYPWWHKDPGFGHRRQYIHDNQESLKIYATHTPMAVRRVQYVRDPWDRFMSFYADKIYNGGDNVPNELRGASLMETIMYVRSHLYDNIHWTPQHVVSGMATEILPISALPGKKEHKGTNDALEITKHSWHALPESVKYVWRYMYLADMILYDYAIGEIEE